MTAPLRCLVIVDKYGLFAMDYLFSGDPARYDRETPANAPHRLVEMVEAGALDDVFNARNAALEVAREQARQRDAAHAQVAALTSALNGLARDEMRGRENELGEDFVQCDTCDASAWGGKDSNDPEDIEHGKECPFRALRDTAAAARDHDRRTFRAGAKWLIGNGSFHYTGRPGAWSPTDAEIDAALDKEGGA